MKEQNSKSVSVSSQVKPKKAIQDLKTREIELSVKNEKLENILHAREHLLQFSVGHTLYELLEETLNKAEDLTLSLVGFFHFVEDDQRTISLQNWSTRTKQIFCEANVKNFHYDLEMAGVWADSIRVKHPVIHNNYSSLNDKKGLPDGHAPILRELVVPVIRNGLVRAVLGVGNKPEDYGEKDLEVISLLADLAWDIAEAKKGEVALAFQHDLLRQLNRFAIELSLWSFEQDNIEKFITRRIKEISGADMALFAGYSPETRTTTVNHVEMDGALLKKALALLGKPLYKLHSKISDEMYLELSTSSVGVRKSLYDMALGAIPKKIAAGIQSLLKYDRFFGLAYVIDGELYGTSVLAMRKDQPDPPKEILENLNSLVAVTLRRKKAEKALFESQENYKTLFKLIPDILYIIDKESGAIEEVNDQAVKTYGYSYQDFIALRNVDISEEPEMTLKATRTINKYSKIPLRYHRKKDGTVFPIEISASTFDVSGKKKILAVGRDITERIKTEENLKNKNSELAKLNTELEQFTYANQDLNQFAYTASHQLQEPIRTISNYLKVIKEDYSKVLDDRSMDYFDTIDEATKRMAFLINSLLEFSRLARNKRMVVVDCNQVIQNVVSELQDIISTTNTIISVDKMPELKLYENEAHQLFHNLIGNAIKFQRPGNQPKIQIHSEKSDGHWKFSICDNGIGIDPVHYDRIFDIFQRLHFNEDEYEGKGIGLAYCKKIVQLHQGSIWVSSIPGRGSTFQFTIPVSLPE